MHTICLVAVGTVRCCLVCCLAINDAVVASGIQPTLVNWHALSVGGEATQAMLNTETDGIPLSRVFYRGGARPDRGHHSARRCVSLLCGGGP